MAHSVRCPMAPQLDADALQSCTDLCDALTEEGFDLDEPAAENARIENVDLSYTTGRGAEFRSCILRHCDFRGARWKNVAFTDVIFDHCDFSNSAFPEGYFQRVRFVGCKMLGADWSRARLYNVDARDCQMRLINLNAAKLNTAAFSDCIAQEAALQSFAVLKYVTFTRCDFTRAEFLHTPLKDIDLTACRIDGILLSGASELRGAIVTPLQALDLSRLLGIVIRDS